MARKSASSRASTMAGPQPVKSGSQLNSVPDPAEREMVCSYCGGSVTWRGPWSNLSHTECEDCGRWNCQVPESEDDDDEA